MDKRGRRREGSVGREGGVGREGYRREGGEQREGNRGDPGRKERKLVRVYVAAKGGGRGGGRGGIYNLLAGGHREEILEKLAARDTYPLQWHHSNRHQSFTQTQISNLNNKHMVSGMEERMHHSSATGENAGKRNKKLGTRPHPEIHQ